MAIVSSFLSLLKRVIPTPGIVPAFIKRAVVNPVVSAMRKAGHAIGSIRDTISAADVAPPEPRYGKDLKRLVSMADMRDATTAWSKGSVFPRRLMIDAELSQNRRYHIYGVLHMYDQNTGDIYPKFVSFYDDVRRTPAEYEEEFMDQYSQNYPRDQTILGMDFEHVIHNQGWDY